MTLHSVKLRPAVAVAGLLLATSWTAMSFAADPPGRLRLSDESPVPARPSRIQTVNYTTSCPNAPTGGGAPVYGPATPDGFANGCPVDGGAGAGCDGDGCCDGSSLCSILLAHKAFCHRKCGQCAGAAVRCTGKTLLYTAETVLPHRTITAEDPAYIDPRDTQVYSAVGFGVPVSVPLAPVVKYQYNYGWGVPSSRLTRVNSTYDRWYPRTWYTQAGSAEALATRHPPVIYTPTDTTQLGFYYSHVPTWGPVADIHGGTPRPMAVQMMSRGSASQAYPPSGSTAPVGTPAPALQPVPVP